MTYPADWTIMARRPASGPSQPFPFRVPGESIPGTRGGSITWRRVGQLRDAPWVNYVTRSSVLPPSGLSEGLVRRDSSATCFRRNSCRRLPRNIAKFRVIRSGSTPDWPAELKPGAWLTMIVPAPNAATHASATTSDSPTAAAAVALLVPPITSSRPTPSISLPGPMNWRLPRRPYSATRSVPTSPPCSNCLVVPPPDPYLAREERRPPATAPRHTPAASRQTAHTAWHALCCASPLPVLAYAPCPGTSPQPAPV